jgi:ribose 5-phosphate isomerase A
MKKAAAEAALALVKSGMKLGLGTGSTARHFVDGVGRLVREGYDLACVPTSEQTRAQAESLGIPLTTLEEQPHLDLCVDGADELDDHLNLIKGGGGALLREKIVATSSHRMVVIADASKHVRMLGAFPLPVEVVRFGVKATSWKIDRALQAAGCQGAMTLRVRDGKPFVTDNGNLIIDCALGRIPDPARLAGLLAVTPGVVDHGLFIGIATHAFVATPEGVKSLSA